MTGEDVALLEDVPLPLETSVMLVHASRVLLESRSTMARLAKYSVDADEKLMKLS